MISPTVFLTASLAWSLGCATTPVSEQVAAPSELAPTAEAPPSTAPIEEAPMPADANLPPLVQSSTEARAAMGTQVRIRGTAYNAKLAAIVESDGLSVYCIELDEWPDALHRQPVEVSGTISRTDQYEARVDKDGAISQGTAGGDWIMTGCDYALAED